MRNITFSVILAVTIIVSGIIGISNSSYNAEKQGDPGGASIGHDWR